MEINKYNTPRGILVATIATIAVYMGIDGTLTYYEGERISTSISQLPANQTTIPIFEEANNKRKVGSLKIIGAFTLADIGQYLKRKL